LLLTRPTILKFLIYVKPMKYVIVHLRISLRGSPNIHEQAGIWYNSQPDMAKDKKGTDLLTRKDIDVKEPGMYKVVLLNDHYTTKEFVVAVLVKVFHKSTPASWKIMLTAHTTGKAVVGLYTYDIARTKVSQARNMAKSEDYPLKLVIEGA
jgi:ATP-dependent Clp protease adaptor protein ClpS